MPKKSSSTAPPKRTLLVTGGAGAVGRGLVEYVHKHHLDEWNLRVFELPTDANERYLRQFKRDATIIFGDLRNPAQVEEAVRGVDAVVHLAAVIPPLADDEPVLAEAVNVGGTRNLIMALQKHAPEAFFLYSSSISVYGDRLKNPWIRVTDPLTPSVGDEYALTKIACEKMVQESGLANWTIFRFAAMVNTNMFQYIVPTMFHMPLDTPVEFCWNIDAALALFRAIDCPQVRHRIFNLSGGPSMRLYYRDVIKKFLAVTGIHGPVLPENAFATCNFHCGFLEDGDELEQLLHFRKHSMDDFLNATARANPLRKRILEWLMPLLRPFIRLFLLRMSEPLHAKRAKDRKLCYRFFGTETPNDARTGYVS